MNDRTDHPLIPEKGALRICLIEPSGNLYGSEYCLLDILKGLSREQYNTIVFLPKSGPFASRLGQNSIRYKDILVPRAHEAAVSAKMFAYIRLLLSLRHFRPDLLYINQAGILRPMVFMNRLLRCSVVCQVQTLEDAKWVSRNPAAHSYVDAFICNSDFIAAHTNVPDNQKSVVYYGYFSKSLKRPRPVFDPNNIIVGLLGRIGGSKGHDLVLKAAEKMKEIGEGRFRFRFIGEAPTLKESQWWRREVDRKGLTEMIEFRGYREDIAAELAELHLMIIPSQQEPFGRILCEAAEAEVPVIVSDSGGLGELSRRFDIGLRHEAKNPLDFIRCLNVAAVDYEDFRNRFCTAGKQMLDTLDYNAYIQHIESILISCAQNHKTAASWYGRR